MHCKIINAPSDVCCKNCGQALTPTDLPPSRFGTPDGYTPKHLVERILNSRAAMEGEHKWVTVLFCDIANSTGLAERIGAEEMHRVLDLFFAEP